MHASGLLCAGMFHYLPQARNAASTDDRSLAHGRSFQGNDPKGLVEARKYAQVGKGIVVSFGLWVDEICHQG